LHCGKYFCFFESFVLLFTFAKKYKVLDIEDIQRSFYETEDILLESHRKSFKLPDLMLKLINEAKIEGLELGQGRSKTVSECDTYAEIE
jgi:hypothetical protein